MRTSINPTLGFADYPLQLRQRELDLRYPKVMGILNITPNSFCNTGRYVDVKLALEYAERMVNDGASIIDVGGEATNPNLPNYQLVTAQEEMDRVLPVIELIKHNLDVAISVDTSQPLVMQAAVAAGADIINDVRALREPGALLMAAQLQVPVCLMHMSSPVSDLQPESTTDEITHTILEFMQQRMAVCADAGIKPENIIIDPGFGSGLFGKNVAENLKVLKELTVLNSLKKPILVGVSRKKFIGEVLNQAVDERLFGSVGLAVLCALQGAAIIRVHDVKPTVDAIKMALAVFCGPDKPSL